MKYVRNEWDRVGACACIVAGVAALVAGYVGVSGTLDTAEQLPYVVSGGMTGLLLLGLGALLWLTADLRDEWRKLDVIDRYLVDADAPGHSTGSADSDAARTASEPRPR